MDKNQITPYPVTKEIKVVVGLPKDGKTEPNAYDNRLTMIFRMGMMQGLSAFGIHTFEDISFDYPEGVRFTFYQIVTGRVFTPLARERIAEEAIRTGADYLFMCDDDMMVPSDLFERLYKHDVDIVAALAFNRYPPHKPVCYEVRTGYDPVEKKEYFANYPIVSYPRDTLVECDAVGFGAVLIKTSALAKVPKPWFMVMSGCGEDIHFCWKAQKAGCKIYMDTATKLGHLGDPHEITEATYDSQENKEAINKECNANK